MSKTQIQKLSVTATIVLAAAVVTAAHAQTGVPIRRAASRQPNLPMELQFSLSAALGQDAIIYHAQASGDGFNALNARQKLAFHFNSKGMEVTKREWPLDDGRLRLWLRRSDAERQRNCSGDGQKPR
jgi:hypothetical protein